MYYPYFNVTALDIDIIYNSKVVKLIFYRFFFFVLVKGRFRSTQRTHLTTPAENKHLLLSRTSQILGKYVILAKLWAIPLRDLGIWQKAMNSKDWLALQCLAKQLIAWITSIAFDKKTALGNPLASYIAKRSALVSFSSSLKEQTIDPSENLATKSKPLYYTE